MSENTKSNILDWPNWLKGLIAAGIGAGANAATLIIVDPINFNLQQGFNKLITVMGVSAFTAICFYLKQSPLPKKKKIS